MLVLALSGLTFSHIIVPAGSTVTTDRASAAHAGQAWDKRLLGVYFLVTVVTFLTAVPAGIGAALLVIRTVLEDRYLADALPGYSDYTHTTRSRLLPGLF